jgi:hypothetical protein
MNWNICKMSVEGDQKMTDSVIPINKCNQNQEQIDKKILDVFKKFEKTFTENSNPLYLDKCGEKVTLQEIQNKAAMGDNSVVLIAVTREQYNMDNFSKYREYIKNALNKDTIYYGLWRNIEKNKTEWDIVYTIDTVSYDEIQKHLNLHNEINNGLAQKMALIIDKTGNWEIQNNENFNEMPQMQKNSAEKSSLAGML